ncbi:MAG: transposase, partial [Desulfurococcaceae archaeon]
MAGDEGFLTLIINMRVRPEAVELLKRYRDALNYSIEWIVKNSVRAGNKYRVPSLSTIHRNLYEKLKRDFGLPSRVAVDCYREALAIAKSYLGNGANGKMPKAKTLR